jgi:hypothetical protein
MCFFSERIGLETTTEESHLLVVADTTVTFATVASNDSFKTLRTVLMYRLRRTRGGAGEGEGSRLSGGVGAEEQQQGSFTRAVGKRQE